MYREPATPFDTCPRAVPASPDAIPQVRVAAEMLGGEIDGLHKAIVTLSDKISHVIRPAAPSEGRLAHGVNTDGYSPLAGDLNGAVAKISDLRRMLYDLIARVDV
jgi:hypothetical protein